jgi:hypothetical protein
VQYQTVPFLTYAFVNLQTVAFYGNYTIIAEKLAWFVNAFLESSGASIGNLIAEGNRKKIVDLFWELICMRYFIGGVFTFATYSLIEPFITIWLGDEYILSTTILFLICLNYFIGYTRGGVMQFLFGYGLFQDVWAPISEIVINLSVAISCGFLWGLEGVLLGVIVSQLLIVGIWKPIFLFRKGFGIPVWLYWIRMSLIASELLIPAIFMNIFVIPNLSIDPSLGYISWIQYSVIIVALYSMCAFTLLYCSISQMRTFVRRFI